jgi:hypothetical protein
MSATKVPRWHPRDWREREALKRWTIERLAETAIADDAALEPGAATRWLAALAADHGNFQPVRALAQARLGLDLKPYLHARKRQRGEYQRHARPWAIERAVEDVRRMRAIWRAHFDGRWRRSDRLAEEIAAERWVLAPGDLANALKRTSRK